MCGRYYIAEDDAAEDLQRIIAEVNRRHHGDPSIKTSGEIRPTDTIPVLANTPSLRPGAYAMRWGYTMPDGTPMFNARSETASSKVMFKDGMAQRRCIIPASHYFEWEKRGKERLKYAIGTEGGSMIYMAGIYRKEGNRAACSILTRDPAAEIAFIHNRMPVILPAEAVTDWLNIRYDAMDVLRAAMLNMEYRPA